MHELPKTGYVRLSQIIGNRKSKPPIPPVIPVSRSTWLAGVKSGIYPPPIRSLGKRITAWRVEDILALVESMSARPQSPAIPFEQKLRLGVAMQKNCATAEQPNGFKDSPPIELAERSVDVGNGKKTKSIRKVQPVCKCLREGSHTNHQPEAKSC
jgi:hypothetical protein